MAGLDVSVLGFAVCDSEQYFIDKIEADIASWREAYPQINAPSDVPFSINDQYVGLGYAKSHNDELTFIARVARQEGVLFDPVYSGKAFMGLVSEIKRDRKAFGSDVVFVHAGGGFGVFPYEQQWQEVLVK